MNRFRVAPSNRSNPPGNSLGAWNPGLSPVCSGILAAIFFVLSLISDCSDAKLSLGRKLLITNIPSFSNEVIDSFMFFLERKSFRMMVDRSASFIRIGCKPALLRWIQPSQNESNFLLAVNIFQKSHWLILFILHLSEIVLLSISLLTRRIVFICQVFVSAKYRENWWMILLWIHCLYWINFVVFTNNMSRS